MHCPTQVPSAVPSAVRSLLGNNRPTDPLFKGRPGGDTHTTRTTPPKASPSLRLPQLVCSNKEGVRYRRPKHITAELRSIVRLDPSQWHARFEHLQNETLVCLIRLTHDDCPDVCAVLIEELRKRVTGRAQKFCSDMDEYDQEQFVSAVEMKVLELALAKDASRQQEILEIAFGRALKNIAIKQLEKFRNSVEGHLTDLAVDNSNVDGAEEGEQVERPIEFLPDLTPSPEDILLDLDVTRHRDRLLHKAVSAVSDLRSRTAVILHHAHGVPVTSSQRGKACLTVMFRKDARQIKYWIATAMKSMRTALGIGSRRPAAFHTTR